MFALPSQIKTRIDSFLIREQKTYMHIPHNWLVKVKDNTTGTIRNGRFSFCTKDAPKDFKVKVPKMTWCPCIFFDDNFHVSDADDVTFLKARQPYKPGKILTRNMLHLQSQQCLYCICVDVCLSGMFYAAVASCCYRRISCYQCYAVTFEKEQVATANDIEI